MLLLLFIVLIMSILYYLCFFLWKYFGDCFFTKYFLRIYNFFQIKQHMLKQKIS